MRVCAPPLLSLLIPLLVLLFLIKMRPGTLKKNWLYYCNTSVVEVQIYISSVNFCVAGKFLLFKSQVTCLNYCVIDSVKIDVVVNQETKP